MIRGPLASQSSVSVAPSVMVWEQGCLTIVIRAERKVFDFYLSYMSYDKQNYPLVNDII